MRAERLPAGVLVVGLSAAIAVGICGIFVKLDHFGPDLRGQDQSGQNFSHRNLRGGRLSGVDFSGANLQGANMVYADLRKTDMTKANLRGANLIRANLTYTTLVAADVSGADFRSAVGLTAGQLACVKGIETATFGESNGYLLPAALILRQSTRCH